ncbi:MAG: efflux RND transporter periplasmic adaptor subunit [Ruminococcaceae bacterium]|nr:efflux RND transporter periplasmic adaptor subunit [Oscillospiraceae bacterium]
MKIVLFICAVLPVLTLGGCALFPEEEEPMPVPLVEVKQAEYATRSPERQTIENCVEGKAKVVAAKQVDVSFTETAGYISKLYFTYGDYVNEGDLLCSLDDPTLGEQLYEAECRAEISELEFARLQERYQNGELDEIAWKQAELNIYIVRRDLQKLRDRFEGTQLYAPMSGVVVYAADINEGAYVNARDVVYSIADTTELFIKFEEIDYVKLPLYAKCELTLDYGGEQIKYDGQVIRTPDNLPEDALNSDKYSVLLKLDRDLPEGIELGTELSLFYLIERSENTITIPKHAIKYVGNRSYVYVLEDGYRRERDILVGIVSEYDAEILEGLDENDLVIY